MTNPEKTSMPPEDASDDTLITRSFLSRWPGATIERDGNETTITLPDEESSSGTGISAD